LVAWAESILQVDLDFLWMLLDLADQVLRLGYTADETLRLANTDSVSQLPNMRAAMSAMESAVASARMDGSSLAVLLIDGDNLRQYNQISYEAGDEVIRLLGTTIQRAVRQSDFLARWRVGDEFLVLMPGTGLNQAQEIAVRLCRAVSRASASWMFPSTVSIGIAVYPDHGGTVRDLIRSAERGLAAAKNLGKNQARWCGEDLNITSIP
jgi:diguanylate cyclase (GGDEF)-like protein